MRSWVSLGVCLSAHWWEPEKERGGACVRWQQPSSYLDANGLIRKEKLHPGMSHLQEEGSLDMEQWNKNDYDCQSGWNYLWEDKSGWITQKKVMKNTKMEKTMTEWSWASRYILNTETWSTGSMTCKHCKHLYVIAHFLGGDLAGLLSLMPFLTQVTEDSLNLFRIKENTFPWLLLFSILFVTPPMTPLFAVVYRTDKHLLAWAVLTCNESPEENSAFYASSSAERKPEAHWVTDLIFTFSEFSREFLQFSVRKAQLLIYFLKE